MYIFSLSSIPPRFSLLEPTLETILAQHARASEVVLYLPRRYRRFPDYDGTLPRVPRGVEIRQVDEDIGPATKMLYAAMEYRDQGVDLIYGDDDRYYHPKLTQRLLEARQEHPEAAIATFGYDLDRLGMRAGTRQPRAEKCVKNGRDTHYRLIRAAQRLTTFPRYPEGLRPTRRPLSRSGYADIAEGFGGVLVKPEYFRPDDMNIPDEAWFMDDIWLSGLLESRGIPIWLQSEARLFIQLEHLPEALADAIIDGADRNGVNLRCASYMIEHFGIWGGKSANSAALLKARAG